MNFGQFLRELREANGFGLREFAGMVNMPASNLSAIESGRRPPFREKEPLFKCAEALGLVAGTNDWEQFFDLAAVGRRPADVELPDEVIPSLLRTVAQENLDETQLRELILHIRAQRRIRSDECG